MQEGENKENCLLRELTNGIPLTGNKTSGILNKGDIECLNDKLICLTNCICNAWNLDVMKDRRKVIEVLAFML